MTALDSEDIVSIEFGRKGGVLCSNNGTGGVPAGVLPFDNDIAATVAAASLSLDMASSLPCGVLNVKVKLS